MADDESLEGTISLPCCSLSFLPVCADLMNMNILKDIYDHQGLLLQDCHSDRREGGPSLLRRYPRATSTC